MHRSSPTAPPAPLGAGPVRPHPPRRWANAYERRSDGTWVYEGSNDPVPGARDLYRSELHGLRAAGDEVFVPTPVAADDAVLRRWIVGVLRLPEVHDARGTGYLVPGEAWRQLDGPVGMSAPELHVHAMLSLRDVSELTGLTESSLRVYRARGTVVAPQVTIARTPLWARPVIERWMVARRRAA